MLCIEGLLLIENVLQDTGGWGPSTESRAPNQAFLELSFYAIRRSVPAQKHSDIVYPFYLLVVICGFDCCFKHLTGTLCVICTLCKSAIKAK